MVPPDNLIPSGIQVLDRRNMPDTMAPETPENIISKKLVCTVCSSCRVECTDSVELTYHYLRHSLLEVAQALATLQVELFSKSCEDLVARETGLEVDPLFMKTIKEEEDKRLDKPRDKKTTPCSKPHQCDTCDKVLSSRSNLKKHMITHKTSKPFTCDACDAAFNQNRDLKSHIMQKHSLQRPHPCKICGKGFVHKFYLDEHLSYHTGEKKFQCYKCGKRFPATSSLTKHMKRHSLLKDFKCDACSKQFTVKADLKAHLKLVHERPATSKGIPTEEPASIDEPSDKAEETKNDCDNANDSSKTDADTIIKETGDNKIKSKQKNKTKPKRKRLQCKEKIHKSVIKPSVNAAKQILKASTNKQIPGNKNDNREPIINLPRETNLKSAKETSLEAITNSSSSEPSDIPFRVPNVNPLKEQSLNPVKEFNQTPPIEASLPPAKVVIISGNKAQENEGYRLTPLYSAGQLTPDLRQLTPDLRQLTPDFRQLTPDLRQLTPDFRQLTPDLRQLTPDFRQLTPDLLARLGLLLPSGFTLQQPVRSVQLGVKQPRGVQLGVQPERGVQPGPQPASGVQLGVQPARGIQLGVQPASGVQLGAQNARGAKLGVQPARGVLLGSPVTTLVDLTSFQQLRGQHTAVNNFRGQAIFTEVSQVNLSPDVSHRSRIETSSHILPEGLQCKATAVVSELALAQEPLMMAPALESSLAIKPLLAPVIESLVAPDLESSMAPGLDSSVAPVLESSVAPDLESSVAPVLELSVAPSGEQLAASERPRVTVDDELPPVLQGPFIPNVPKV